MPRIRSLETASVLMSLLYLLTPAASADLQPPRHYGLFERAALLDWVGQRMELVGTYDLLPRAEGPDMDHYAVAEFRALSPHFDTVIGKGEYWIGGERPYVHRMVLDVIINDSDRVRFDSGLVESNDRFPMIGITLPSDPPHWVWKELVLLSGPVLQYWFSTEIPFTAGDGRTVGAGAMLNNGGRVVCSNRHLTRNLDLDPPGQDIGLDALFAAEIDTPPGWEVWFSAEVDAFSRLLGPLSHGDLLSEAGRVVVRNAELTRLFDPDPEAVGLDSITWSSGCNGWYFSSETDFFSRSLGRWVGEGDMLCAAHGMIVMDGAALLRKFHPLQEPEPLGLDALHLWPTGEVWFSLERGFVDAEYGPVGEGDLLSDSGWVIARNRDLVARFAPQEDRDFGLDALFVLEFPTGDLDLDGCVGQADLALLLSGYGEDDRGDVDFDGDTDQADLALLLANWGAGCTPREWAD